MAKEKQKTKPKEPENKSWAEARLEHIKKEKK